MNDFVTEYGFKQGCLKLSKLSDLCIEKIGVQTGPFGSQLHNKDYVDYGTPIITVEHLGENTISHKNTPFVSNEDRKRLSKYSLEVGDIVFSRVGSVDRRALVSEKEVGWLFSGRCLRVRVNKNSINPKYLSYFFDLDSFKKYIRSIAVGATMPSINTKILSDVPIYYIESLDQQEKIAEFLSAFDDKIQLNTQINQTLEAIAQAIFKSWFVDFDPVRAKAQALSEGKSEAEAILSAMAVISGKGIDTLDPAEFDQLHQIAKAFPSELVENEEFGEVPKGWGVKKIGEVLETVGGATPSTKNNEFWDNGDIYWTTPKDLSSLTDKILLNTERKITQAGVKKISSGVLPINTVLLSSRAPVGYLALTKIPVAINQGYIAIKNSKNLNCYYTLQWCVANMSEIKSRAVGTTFAEISKSVFREIPIILPNSEILSFFEDQLNEIYNKITENLRENQNLAETRDLLLPKLLSGEIEL